MRAVGLGIQLPRAQCLHELGLDAGSRFVLAVFHPVVQEQADAMVQTQALLVALGHQGLPVVWLEPNADAGSRGILQALDGAALPAGSRRLRHLPRALFAAAMRHCDAMVGNSSAGVIEAVGEGVARELIVRNRIFPHVVVVAGDE